MKCLKNILIYNAIFILAILILALIWLDLIGSGPGVLCFIGLLVLWLLIDLRLKIRWKRADRGERILLIFRTLTGFSLLAFGLITVLLLWVPDEFSVNPPVEHYDRRIEIWDDQIPCNLPRDKKSDMNIEEGISLPMAATRFFAGITGEEYRDVEMEVDTQTWLYEIDGGYEKETYEDESYLIPYPVKNSERAVIILPGGGFGYKSMERKRQEGADVAGALNKAGVSAFILHYRSNPYLWPVPALDLQRAVRYLKVHAEEYALDPEQISLLGFSAGGYLAGSYINEYAGADCFPEDYRQDATDLVDASVDRAAMIYPALTFQYNVGMLFACFDADHVRNAALRETLLEERDLKQHLNSQRIPQFISYGTADMIVDSRGTEAYIDAALAAGCDVTVKVAGKQNHQYKMKYYWKEYLNWLKDGR